MNVIGFGRVTQVMILVMLIFLIYQIHFRKKILVKNLEKEV